MVNMVVGNLVVIKRRNLSSHVVRVNCNGSFDWRKLMIGHGVTGKLFIEIHVHDM